MSRSLASLAILGLLFGCAAPRNDSDHRTVTDAAQHVGTSRTASDEVAPTPVETAALATENPFPYSDLGWNPAPSFAPEPTTLAQRDAKRAPSGQYVTLKGGWLEPEESDFDSGYLFNAAFGHYLNPMLALDFETGYLSVDAKGSSADVEAIPMLVNARICVPVWQLEIYGGGGIGSMYYDLSSRSVDAHGWLFSTDFFVGADIELMDKLTAGVELKYYITDKLRNTSDNLNALALMATVGWRF